MAAPGYRPRDYPALLARLDGLRTLGVELGLDRVRDALSRVGSPELRVPALQIAGTNGKGSTAAMTEAILRAAGIRTGLFTSPHLSRFTERIRVDGREVSGDALAVRDERVEATGVRLTYFEVSALLAFLTFAEEGVDIAVIETGLGGRLDAATTCHAVATAITTIALDHADVLGETLAAIAREKAGIARAGIPLLMGLLPAEADAAVVAAAAAAGAPIQRVGPDFARLPSTAAVRLEGRHQRDNAAIAVELARLGCAHLGRTLTEDQINAGLRGTRWPGRLETVAPGVVLDCAHNPEGAMALAAAVEALPRPRVLVVSVVRDKDARLLIDILAPGFDEIYATRSASPRALPAEDLAAFRPGAVAIPSPRDALARAVARAGQGGVVVVAGSIFLIGDVRALVTGELVDPVRVSDPL